MIRPADHVLFQGDSITNAFRKPDEVCNAYQLGSGYAMIAAAHLLSARPRDNLRFTNRGVCGDGLEGLAKRWQADCLDLRPDVVSILAGINDVAPTRPEPATSLVEYERRFRELLIQTRAALPAVRLVLCEPFVLRVGGVAGRPATGVGLRWHPSHGPGALAHRAGVAGGDESRVIVRWRSGGALTRMSRSVRHLAASVARPRRSQILASASS